jgi:hypothetical protein
MNLHEELMERLARRRSEKLGGLSPAAYAELLLAVRENPQDYVDDASDQAFMLLAQAAERVFASRQDDEFRDDEQFMQERARRMERLRRDCAEALATARRRVTDGTSISGPLASSGVFPRLMTDMLAIGEQAGDMAGSLEHIGRRYQKEMEQHITAFTNALEPLLIVLVAGVVGFLAIAILMAVFKVSSSLG